MEKLFTTTEIAKDLGVSSQAILKWESDFNLVIARDPSTKHRMFTEKDLQVFRIINKLKKEGKTKDQIIEELAENNILEMQVQGASDLVSVNQLNQMNMQQIRQVLNSQILEPFKEDLKEQIREEVRNEIKVESEKTVKILSEKIEELQKILEAQQNQGFWSKLFKK